MKNKGAPNATRYRLLASHRRDLSSFSKHLVEGSLASPTLVFQPFDKEGHQHMKMSESHKLEKGRKMKGGGE
jgi:hypothetical protein